MIVAKILANPQATAELMGKDESDISSGSQRIIEMLNKAAERENKSQSTSILKF